MPASRRRPARRRAGAGLTLLACLAVASAPFAWAEPAAKSDDKAIQEQQLRGVEDTMRASEDQRRRIEANVETLRADRARASTAALIDITAKVQDTERQMDAANGRLTILTGSENALAPLARKPSR